jgi:hypothetical protein
MGTDNDALRRAAHEVGNAIGGLSIGGGEHGPEDVLVRFGEVTNRVDDHRNEVTQRQVGQRFVSVGEIGHRHTVVNRAFPQKFLERVERSNERLAAALLLRRSRGSR